MKLSEFQVQRGSTVKIRDLDRQYEQYENTDIFPTENPMSIKSALDAMLNYEKVLTGKLFISGNKLENL